MTRRLAIILVLLIAAAGTAALAATFGRETFGATDESIEGIISCGKFSPSTSGTVTAMAWYTSNTTSTKATKAAIYSYVSDTEAGTLLAQSAETSSAVDAAWRSASASAAVVASTNYFLCAWSAASTGVNVLETSTSGGIHWEDSQTYGAWPEPLTEGAQDAILIPVYATYTETSTGVTRVIGGGLIE